MCGCVRHYFILIECIDVCLSSYYLKLNFSYIYIYIINFAQIYIYNQYWKFNQPKYIVIYIYIYIYI